MKKLSKFHFALLSLLVPVGFATLGFVINPSGLGTNLIWAAYVLIFIGGASVGMLLRK
jgi:hypothetical protein